MTGYAFDWHGLRLEARRSGALWWPEGRWLVVADLHLGKSERMARRGGALLPPWGDADTLRRLTGEIEALGPAVVVSLGDGFDDDAAADALDGNTAAALTALAAGRDWIWIAGNHDPAVQGADLPGCWMPLLELGTALLRHEAVEPGPDISGHYHPVVRLAGARHRAFLIGSQHLILPAFGSYTGGLAAGDPALAPLVAGGYAIACAHRALAVPLTAPARGVRPGAARS